MGWILSLIEWLLSLAWLLLGMGTVLFGLMCLGIAIVHQRMGGDPSEGYRSTTNALFLYSLTVVPGLLILRDALKQWCRPNRSILKRTKNYDDYPTKPQGNGRRL